MSKYCPNRFFLGSMWAMFVQDVFENQKLETNNETLVHSSKAYL